MLLRHNLVLYWACAATSCRSGCVVSTARSACNFANQRNELHTWRCPRRPQQCYIMSAVCWLRHLGRDGECTGHQQPEGAAAARAQVFHVTNVLKSEASAIESKTYGRSSTGTCVPTLRPVTARRNSGMLRARLLAHIYMFSHGISHMASGPPWRRHWRWRARGGRHHPLRGAVVRAGRRLPGLLQPQRHEVQGAAGGAGGGHGHVPVRQADR